LIAYSMASSGKQVLLKKAAENRYQEDGI